MRKLHGKLLIPLLFLAGMSFFVAKSLSPSLDYSNIFLNLTTDFIVVIITIYYVDSVLKTHENERWKRADYSIISRIGNNILILIERICILFDLSSVMQEMYPKLYGPRGSSQFVVYLYFISEMTKKTPDHFQKLFMALTEEDREKINNTAKDCSPILSQALLLYGNRLPPELLLEIVDTQESIRLFLDEPSKDGFAIRILLEHLANIVEATRVEQLELHMKVDKKPRDQ